MKETKLIALLEKIGPKSKHGITTGIDEVEVWRKSAPKEEREKVFDGRCVGYQGKDLRARMEKLEAMAKAAQ